MKTCNSQSQLLSAYAASTPGLPARLSLPFAQSVKALTGRRPAKRRLHPGSVAIYGLFDRLGRCYYVGQTMSAESRRHGHKMRFPGLVYRNIGRLCAFTEARDREDAAILKYKKLGQCQLNKRLKGKTGPAAGGQRVLWVEANILFASRDHAAVFFRCSRTTIHTAVKFKYLLMDGVTLRFEKQIHFFVDYTHIL